MERPLLARRCWAACICDGKSNAISVAFKIRAMVVTAAEPRQSQMSFFWGEAISCRYLQANSRFVDKPRTCSIAVPAVGRIGILPVLLSRRDAYVPHRLEARATIR